MPFYLSIIAHWIKQIALIKRWRVLYPHIQFFYIEVVLKNVDCMIYFNVFYIAIASILHISMLVIHFIFHQFAHIWCKRFNALEVNKIIMEYLQISGNTALLRVCFHSTNAKESTFIYNIYLFSNYGMYTRGMLT